ncbi:OPT family oligopeptide transporter [Acinetobacter rudis]|uniref:OPT family oligopeptide transporter n=1 Tax=Acinetobacter rudis CIP 110305 TaxID=421052 RepID=S3NIE9_9GAMM|nr:oligopeptide transporter, OPT family [Acinetobacter rudis]EPF79830.1 OPT family oligopeptide transporter [Acinetobacter rudis CIP 110305]
MNKNNDFSDPYQGLREITLRGVILGICITLIFTASNIYLGLKVGLTFATSIPAAVLSMAILKFAKDSNILENNMVQTQASAAGTISSVIFVIPGLLMLGYWQSFPFWQTTLICLSGGILGVIFTIPLRYVMVVNSALPYPEGIAAAEILKSGAQGVVANQHGEIIQNPQAKIDRQPAKEILYGSLLAATVSFATNGLRIIGDGASFWFKLGQSIFQIPMGFSLALIGAGSLISLASGIAVLVGAIIAWGIAVPYFTGLSPTSVDIDMASFAQKIWAEKVRMMGVGTLGIAAIWTLLTLLKPMIQGVRLSIATFLDKNPQQSLSRAKQDLSPRIMLFTIFVMGIILFLTFYSFVMASSLSPAVAWGIVLLLTLLTMAIGFLVAAACGYMAGLVGSSSSPISGIGILAILVFAAVLLLIAKQLGLLQSTADHQFLTALGLFATTAVIAIACISNDNLQDLKTGYLIYATPAKQQIALIIGCVAGAIVIAPVLDLLYQAYGFTGALPRSDMDPHQALAAPQAILITTIAQGIFSHQLEWTYILIGVGLGIFLIILDGLIKALSSNNISLPVLAVGMGIYLPPSVNMPLFVGALMFWWIKRQAVKDNNDPQHLQRVERRGTLFAAGLIVGESLMGILMALIIVISLNMGTGDAPLALHLDHWDTMAQSLGLIIVIITIFIFIRRCLKK